MSIFIGRIKGNPTLNLGNYNIKGRVTATVYDLLICIDQQRFPLTLTHIHPFTHFHVIHGFYSGEDDDDDDDDDNEEGDRLE